MNVNITPGRYFTVPAQSGANCWWDSQYPGYNEDNSLFGYSVPYAFGQWIVDIYPGDTRFSSGAGCGKWSMTPSAAPPPAGTITPGLWLVGAQIQFGTYESSASGGFACYWAKLRDFRHTLQSVINASFSRRVPIGRDDTGFYTNAACGTWTRIGPAPDE